MDNSIDGSILATDDGSVRDNRQPAVGASASNTTPTTGQDGILGPQPIIRDFAYDPIVRTPGQGPIIMPAPLPRTPTIATPRRQQQQQQQQTNTAVQAGRTYEYTPTSVNQYTYRDVPVAQSHNPTPNNPTPPPPASPVRPAQSMMPPPPPPPSPARPSHRPTNPLSSSSSSASQAVAAASRLAEAAARQLASTTRRQQRYEAAAEQAAAAAREQESQSASSSLPSVEPRVSPRLALARQRRQNTLLERLESLREEARQVEPPPTPAGTSFTSGNFRLSRESNLRLGRPADYDWNQDRGASLDRGRGYRPGEDGGDGHGYGHGHGQRYTRGGGGGGGGNGGGGRGRGGGAGAAI